MDQIDYEQRCHNLISALFNIQDRWKKCSKEIEKDGSIIEIIEGPEMIYIIRSKKTMRIGWIENNKMRESKYYMRMTAPNLATDVPMMLMHYLMFLELYQRGAAK